MGQFAELSVIMQFLIAASLLVADINAQLVTHANGAVTPYDPNLAIATNAHLAAKGYLGYGYPYAYGHGVVYGKREAEPAHLVTHANGAVTPYDPNLAIASKGYLGYGYPYAYRHGVVYGKREAQVPVSLVTGFSHVAHPYFGHFGVAPVVSPFVAHPNGALVPAEPQDVVDARAEHLAAHAA